jgi:hypothetical protein
MNDASRDPLERAAMATLESYVELSLDVGMQIDPRTTGLRPVLTLLATARHDAAEALRTLIDADPLDHKEIMRLQNEARRYGDLVKWTRQIVAMGNEADQRLDAEDFDEVRSLIEQPDALAEDRAARD